MACAESENQSRRCPMVFDTGTSHPATICCAAMVLLPKTTSVTEASDMFHLRSLLDIPNVEA
ncbi:hypothetical protein NUU61_004487 [Penicillium alfredii]|uniref:Uncharacterized protein n=1 Tax=Penicillium alfredii TaxID=1506179 RepID=A0A9W9FL99_9EURO|nr:uncharacterized protein NUU61_004487 [Penicillium alfredii]KAJ5102265.1 hypothetical protein NUU61_004487 [Penicillium alfredii]